MNIRYLINNHLCRYDLKNISMPYRLNLIGIRNKNKVNSFNDDLYYFYIDDQLIMHSTELISKFTTDPGNTYLTKPMNSKGCAILKEGYHKDIWKLGYHKGKYKALVQANPVTVYRDNNRDLELDCVNEHTGYFGINLHRASVSVRSRLIGSWSAGCQVISDPFDYADLIDTVELCVSKGQKYFSYLLLDKDNL